jgi:hypothetical protein
MVKPTAAQQGVEQLFPAIAQWVRGYKPHRGWRPGDVRVRRQGAGLRRAGLRGR